MKRSVFNQIEKLNTLQSSLESKIGDFMGLNLKNILKEIIKGEHIENEDGEYHINLGTQYTIVLDGEAFTASEIIYNEDDDEAYFLTEETDDYIVFTDIEPIYQLSIITCLIEELFS